MKALLLFVLTVWLHFQDCTGTASYSCSHSPSTWCSSLESAIECGVLKQCLETNFTRSRQTADPVTIGLYFESLCPGCRNFLTSMLYPTWVLLADVMDVTLVPYGNALETWDGKKYKFQCQHGEDECLGNMIETCLLNLTNDDAFPIIYCMETSSDVIKAAKMCAELYAPQLDWGTVMNCVNGDLGNQLMHQNALKTTGLKPPHNYVPWITINGVHTEELQNQAMSALLPMVCNMYKGPKPEVCGGKQRHYRSYCHKTEE